MHVSIINIGDELLIGQVVNTNASTMSKKLIAAGMDVRRVVTIPDEAGAIRATIIQELQSADAVLVTGGLGPTKDDITKHTIAELFHSPLEENQEALDNIRRIFESRGYELTPINRLQAAVPQCCTMVNNQVGTAPCMWFDENCIAPAINSSSNQPKVLVCMPGVPHEMEWLMDNEVINRLQQHFHTTHIISKNIVVQGIGESFLSDLIEPWEQSLPQHIRLAYLPQAGMVKLRLTARGENREVLLNQIKEALQGLYPIADKYIVGVDHESIPELVADLFTSHQLTLSSAESCTGGYLSSKLTAMPGASRYFMGSVVSYSNNAKEQMLGVAHQTLIEHGAVSEPTAIQMAEGARTHFSTDYAVATTGIAGPNGGTPEKPVGTVWIAVAGPHGTTTQLLQLGNDRQRTIERTTNALYSLLIKIVKSEL